MNHPSMAVQLSDHNLVASHIVSELAALAHIDEFASLALEFEHFPKCCLMKKLDELVMGRSFDFLGLASD